MLKRLLTSAGVYFMLMLPALAHPEHSPTAGPFAEGVMHPFLGVDHVLAMVTVGLWAAYLGGRALFALPVAFIVGTTAGFYLAVTGVALPMVEPAIGVSVLLLGLLVAAAARLPTLPSTLLVGFFAVFHGHAHGSEMSGGVLMFGLGFVLATAILHTVGLAFGRILQGRGALIVRWVGGIVAGMGLLLLGGWA